MAVAKLNGANVTHEQFLLHEMRVVCSLHENGLEDDAVINKVVQKNLFQYPTEHKLRRMAQVCVARMNAANSESIVHTIAVGGSQAASQANLYAMMCSQPIIRDFMVNEVSRRLSDYDYALGPMEMNAYITRLQVEYEDIGLASHHQMSVLAQR